MVFDVDELAAHAAKVYDITSFLQDHPGGDDIILKYAGQDVETVMKDKTEDEHSDSAYDMLDEYAIGRLGCTENIARDDWEAEDDFDSDATDPVEDLKKRHKAYHLRQVNQPRHLTDSARLFGSDYLEVSTKSKWYVVPLFWLPIAFYLFLQSALQFTTPLPLFMVDPTLPSSGLANLSADSLFKTLNCFFIGNFIWTLLELHHTQLPAYLKEMKKYHLAHHYKNFDLGFGVMSKIWDVIFDTVLPV
ncbi:fatty acid-2 hydroxylase [Lentinula raphanica]|nr:fatty acid-2 hydroxylase [Lentinula raphanica]